MAEIFRNSEEEKIVLSVAPHPDDESIGAPATLMNLRDAGFRIINLGVSLGKPEQYDRRRAELQEACDRAGYELIVPEKPALISGGDDIDKAQTDIAAMIGMIYEDLQPDIVVSPSVHDAHHGHEVVARAVRDTLQNRDGSRWWMYNIWGDLPIPTIYSPFSQKRMDQVLHTLGAYEGENDRNDYRRMVHGKSVLNTVLGSEKVFGFGSDAASGEPYADLLTETIWSEGEWITGQKRVLDHANPLGELAVGTIITSWVNSTSPYESHRRQLGK